GQNMGIAIKVLDGGKSPKYAAAIALLKQMAWITPSVADTLESMFINLSKYKRLEVVGELSMP
ncbi:MAG: asparaginase, partial [Moorea sp. SIO3C2]|nr:asparaginase [Moorena sp. SIO3C2]